MLIPERVDPQDAAAFDAWYDVYGPALDDGREYPTSWTREEMRVQLLRPSAYSAKEMWAIRDEAGAIAGTLGVQLSLKDNTSVIAPTIAVRRDVRRRGLGSALVRLVDQRAAELGRTVIQGQVNAPLEGEGPGQAFVRAQGFELANLEVHRVLELPLDKALLDKLAVEAAERHGGYQLLSWQDRCPEELVDAYAALQGTFAMEAPQGDLGREAEAWDADRVRFVEEQSLAEDRHGWITVAMAPDGSLAGNTELYLGEQDAAKAYQWGTLVSPPHRGHRLGLALKVRNHQELQRMHPERVVVHTWNGEQNTFMNAVNAKLGFRPVELSQEWQRMAATATAES